MRCAKAAAVDPAISLQKTLFHLQHRVEQCEEALLDWDSRWWRPCAALPYRCIRRFPLHRLACNDCGWIVGERDCVWEEEKAAVLSNPPPPLSPWNALKRRCKAHSGSTEVPSAVLMYALNCTLRFLERVAESAHLAQGGLSLVQQCRMHSTYESLSSPRARPKWTTAMTRC